jgi:putative hydroxymethylpyrimidine transport system substrate-binding protein
MRGWRMTRAWPAIPPRARWIARLGVCCLALAMQAQPAWAGDKLTVLLDWFVNPDHAPLMVAEYIGAYRQAGLDVTFVSPADSSMPARLVAAKFGDIAIASQPTLYIYDMQGLSLVRVGALMNAPLASLAAIDTRSIRSIADLKGRRIGMSNISPQISQVWLATALGTAGLTLKDVKIVSIGDQLVTSLLTRQVDAVPIMPTFESIELTEHGAKPIEFPYQNYGVPPYDTFIYVVRRDRVHDPKIARFLAAVRKGALYLEAHPNESLAMFLKAHPDLDNPLNRAAWWASLPYFATDPAALDRARYDRFADYLVKNHVLPSRPTLDSYAVDLQ